MVNCFNTHKIQKSTGVHNLSAWSRGHRLIWISITFHVLINIVAAGGKRLIPSCSMTSKNSAEL